MRQTSGPKAKPSAEAALERHPARHAPPVRRWFSGEEKSRVVIEGLRGPRAASAELCRREGIATSMVEAWSKEFLDAGEKRLSGATARAATSDEVRDLRREAGAGTLEEVVADPALENRLLEKGVSGDGEDGA